MTLSTKLGEKFFASTLATQGRAAKSDPSSNENAAGAQTHGEQPFKARASLFTGRETKVWTQGLDSSLRQRVFGKNTRSDEEALREAKRATKGLLPPGAEFRVADGLPRKNATAFYEAQEQDNRLFIKVRRCARASGPWVERAIAQQASAYGFSPRVFPAPQAPQAIVSEAMRCPTLSFEQSQEPEFQTSFLDLMRRLHALTAKEQPDVFFEADMPEWHDWQSGKLKQGPANQALLDMTLVGGHVEELLAAIARTPVSARFCHYDVIPRNIFWTSGRTYLVDWELARYGDPLRDLAKFFGSSQLQVGEIGQVLTTYYQRAPRQAEQAHFLRLVQAHSVDSYLHMVRSKRVQTEEFKQRAQQVVELGRALTNIDTQAWWLKDAEPNLISRSALMAAANDAAHSILGSNYKLLPNDLERSHRGCATFRAKSASQHIFIKFEKLGTSQRPDEERNATRRAAELQIGPAFYDLADSPFAIVTENLAAPALKFTHTLLPSVRQQLLAHLRVLHRSENAPANIGAPELVIDGWVRWKKQLFATNSTNYSLFEPAQLDRYMQSVCDEIAAAQVTQVPCHFDTLRRNMLSKDGKLWLIDWGLARWGDPIRDLAKFFGFNGLFGHEASTMLRWYYEREPTSRENRHFLLLLQAMAVDHLSWMMTAQHDRMEGARHKVPQIISFAELLSDLPALGALHK